MHVVANFIFNLFYLNFFIHLIFKLSETGVLIIGNSMHLMARFFRQKLRKICAPTKTKIMWTGLSMSLLLDLLGLPKFERKKVKEWKAIFQFYATEIIKDN